MQPGHSERNVGSADELQANVFSMHQGLWPGILWFHAAVDSPDYSKLI